jgi:prepilin-type N-terminal cleavage/methylation domain-containing protein
MNTQGHKQDRSQRAFTMIELLTVITIMGIIAALVVTMGGAASEKKKTVATEGMKERLITMIDNYQAKLNYYPPDNGTNITINAFANPTAYDGYTATNPLLYELTGATNLNNGANLAVFNSSSLPESAYAAVFGRGGIANGDALEPHNFFQPRPASKDYAPYAIDNGVPICGLIVPTFKVPGNTNNFWHYDSSTTNRHNPNSFDLWAEYYVGSKSGQPTIRTNGNW